MPPPPLVRVRISLAAVDIDRVGGLDERQRLALRRPAAFVEDRHREAGDDVGLVRGRIGQPLARRRAVLLAQRQRAIRLGPIDLVARRLQVQLDPVGGHVALRPAQVGVAGVGRPVRRLFVLEVLRFADRSDPVPWFLGLVALLQHRAGRRRSGDDEIALLGVDRELVALNRRLPLPQPGLSLIGRRRERPVVVEVGGRDVDQLVGLQHRGHLDVLRPGVLPGGLQHAFHVAGRLHDRSGQDDVDPIRIHVDLFVRDVRPRYARLGPVELERAFVEDVPPRGSGRKQTALLGEPHVPGERGLVDRAHPRFQREVHGLGFGGPRHVGASFPVVDLARELRVSQSLGRLAAGVEAGGLDDSSRAAGIRRERQLHGVAALQRHGRRAVGRERHVQQVRDDLAPGRALLSRHLQHRVADDQGVLERFAVGSVFQIHVAAAERLQRAGAGLGFGDSRIAAQFDAVDVLLVVFQMGEAVVGLDHLATAQGLDAAFEPQVLVAARHRRRRCGDFRGARAAPIRGDQHMGLIEDDQHVQVLVVGHAHARPGEPLRAKTPPGPARGPCRRLRYRSPARCGRPARRWPSR